MAKVQRSTETVVVTHKPLVWLWRTVAYYLVAGAPAAAFCGVGVSTVGDVNPSAVVAPARWWRREARLGLARLERELGL